jgi:hypothetical protein
MAVIVLNNQGGLLTRRATSWAVRMRAQSGKGSLTQGEIETFCRGEGIAARISRIEVIGITTLSVVPVVQGQVVTYDLWCTLHQEKRMRVLLKIQRNANRVVLAHQLSERVCGFSSKGGPRATMSGLAVNERTGAAQRALVQSVNGARRIKVLRTGEGAKN